MKKYMLYEGYEDCESQMDETFFEDEASAREAYDASDPRQVWRTEWMCLPAGGRERLKRRRQMKELWVVEWDEDGYEFAGDPLEHESYGYDEFLEEESPAE